MLIWSRPKSAAGTRLTYEIATTSASTDVTRVHRPIVKSNRMHHRDGVGRPHRLRGTQNQKE